MRRRDPDLVIRAVGRRVAEVRAERGLTQAAFAEACGLTTKHVQKIELGQLNLTIRSLVRLANHLGIDPGALFEQPGDLRVRRGRPSRSAADENDEAEVASIAASHESYTARRETVIGLAEKKKEGELAGRRRASRNAPARRRPR